MNASTDNRVLPDPDEAGISVDERVRRIGMAGNFWLHPDYTDRELRMLADLGSLIEFVYNVLPVLKRHGIHYPLMPDHVVRMAHEYGSWCES